RGTTVKVRTLTQRIDELAEFWNDPVRVVISGLRTEYTFGTGSKTQSLTPGQLLERLGFSSAQLSTPVKDLSGGQQRRLQLLLVLLDQPNVLILDEPSERSADNRRWHEHTAEVPRNPGDLEDADGELRHPACGARP